MHNKASLVLSVAIMIVSVYGIVSAWGWPWKAALFPLVIAIPLFCLATIEVACVLFGANQTSQVSDFKLSDHLPRKVMLRRTLAAVGWILAFFAAILLVGFPIAVPVFVFLYLKIQGKEGWLLSVIFTAAIWAVFYGLFDRLLHLPFPAGWLLEWIGLTS